MAVVWEAALAEVALAEVAVVSVGGELLEDGNTKPKAHGNQKLMIYRLMIYVTYM